MVRGSFSIPVCHPALAVAASCLLAGGAAGRGLADFFLAELRGHEAEAAALEAELAVLPPAPGDQATERHGWHSAFAASDGEARSVVVDLGEVKEFDLVALVPVGIPQGLNLGEGYGFPVRFRVESFDDPGNLPVTLADHTGTDFPAPGNLPVTIDAAGGRGRYLRVTATRLYRPHNGLPLFALGEIMVLRGEVNLAAGVAVSEKGGYLNPPGWHPENLTDGQSVLGPPLLPESSPTNGWHSREAESADAGAWVQVDLGREWEMEEVRLYPARPGNYPPRRGFGFPVRFRVEASSDPDFAAPAVLLDRTHKPFPNPGENCVGIPVPGVRARHVRVTASELWPRDRVNVFALGEMEVYAGGINVAARAPVRALDSTERDGWSARALTDGFTSQGRIVPLASWLRGLSLRREKEAALAALRARRGPLEARARGRMLWTGAGAGLAGIAAAGWFAAGRRRHHRRELAALRRNIASDLHDEIGSNLGSMALLADQAERQDPPEARANLAEIHRIARETADSMRDIVWLIQTRRNPDDLEQRMREAAGSLLAGLSWTFESRGIDSAKFNLEFERQVFLLFKEALHNVSRHARAGRVAVRMTWIDRAFSLSVEDDGTGFDPAVPAAGHGLASMRHRAERVGGHLSIESSPGGGTRLSFHARLK